MWSIFPSEKGRHCCTNWHKLCKGKIPVAKQRGIRTTTEWALLFQKAEDLRFHVQFEWGAHLQNGLRSQVTPLMGWVTLFKKCRSKWKVPVLDHPSGSTYFLEADLVTRLTYLWANISCLQLHFVGQPRPVIQRRINSMTLLQTPEAFPSLPNTKKILTWNDIHWTRVAPEDGVQGDSDARGGVELERELYKENI